MAKAIGLIGNFKGKVGNMVGYQIPDSNTGNTQGIRIYQPVVKNPKTSAQAEQRAKLAPINATYRALKSIIDRGNEGLPYGNKSRLAWLKGAFAATNMPWIIKGENVNYPVGCKISKGSLAGVAYGINRTKADIESNGVTSSTPVSTVAAVTAALKTGNPQLKDGDQLTFVFVCSMGAGIGSVVKSIVLDSTDTTEVSGWTADDDVLSLDMGELPLGYTVIVSRQGSNGEHLRSTEELNINPDYEHQAPYDDASKQAAVKSYMSSAAVNSDWAEESIQ